MIRRAGRFSEAESAALFPLIVVDVARASLFSPREQHRNAGGSLCFATSKQPKHTAGGEEAKRLGTRGSTHFAFIESHAHVEWDVVAAEVRTVLV